MKYFFYLLIALAFAACTSTAAPTEEATSTTTEATITDSAAWVVQKAIVRHGGEQLENSDLSFSFRDRAYRAKRSSAGYTYWRNYTNKAGEMIADQLTDMAFTRTVNGIVTKLSPKDSSGLANSLNSVMYFAFLPYFLQDEAVHLTYEGKTTIKDEAYYEIGVSFSEDGGGKDFEDEYVYWFRQSDFRLDYLAYNFLVNGGGARFRSAYNSREVNGVTFQDYVNYKPANDEREVLRFDDLFNAGAMDTLSLIVLEIK